MKSMDCVLKDLEDHVTWINNCYATNDDVKFEDPLHDDIAIKNMLHVSLSLSRSIWACSKTGRSSGIPRR